MASLPGQVAQWLERRTPNANVMSSTPRANCFALNKTKFHEPTVIKPQPAATATVGAGVEPRPRTSLSPQIAMDKAKDVSIAIAKTTVVSIANVEAKDVSSALERSRKSPWSWTRPTTSP